MNLIKRIKKTWKLATKDEKSLEDFMKLSDKEMMMIPDEDTKATFISPGSREEYEEFESEQKGLKGWKERLKNL